MTHTSLLEEAFRLNVGKLFFIEWSGGSWNVVSQHDKVPLKDS